MAFISSHLPLPPLSFKYSLENQRMWAKLKKRLSGEANKQMSMSKNRSSSNVVDKEYIEALHTKSFVDVYSRFQPTIRVERSTTTFLPTTLSSKNTSNELLRTFSSPLCNHEKDDHISDFPLEFMQESLLTVATSPNSTPSRFLTHLNDLFLDFYDTNTQMTAACTSLISSINCARSHHRNIHRLLFSSSSSSSSSTPCAFSQLSSLLELDNPLSPKALSHFHSVHSHYPTLIRGLTSANQKICRRLKLCRITKYASCMALVALSAAVAATIVIASHGAAAVAVAPVATAGIGLKGRTGKRFRGWKRLRAKVDVAAKAAYIVGRDLDTLSQMVMTVHDDIENGRDMARMVVEKREWEMVKEMERRGEMGLGLEEHLQELEEHVYLCLTAINRSWRLVA